MAGSLQPIQPLTSELHGSFGAPVPIQIPANLEIPQGSEHQIQLLLIQILSQLRIQKECSTALDDLQKEKIHWNTVEEELENKLFELKKEKRQLEAAIGDLQFENQQLRKGKCNITETSTELLQNNIYNLEGQFKEIKQRYDRMQIEWEIERNEYEKNFNDAHIKVFEETEKVLQANVEIQRLKVELEACKSSELCQEQENLGSHALLKDKIKKFFSFLEEHQLDINTTFPLNKWTSLHVAAAYGDITVIEVILESGADIDALDDSDTTPLMLAAVRGNAAAAHYLIKKNATLTVKDKYGYNALHFAAYGGYADTVHTLIKNGYTALNIPNDFQEYPLHLAAYHNHTGAVQVLLNSGIPVDPLDGMSRTPLHRAAEHGNLEVVEMLVQHKANTTVKSSEGKIPWDYAIEDGHQDVATYLLNATNSA